MVQEKEDLLKVYSARDGFIDEIVSKNEQLEDDISRLRIAETEAKVIFGYLFRFLSCVASS